MVNIMQNIVSTTQTYIENNVSKLNCWSIYDIYIYIYIQSENRESMPIIIDTSPWCLRKTQAGIKPTPATSQFSTFFLVD